MNESLEKSKIKIEGYLIPIKDEQLNINRTGMNELYPIISHVAFEVQSNWGIFSPLVYHPIMRCFLKQKRPVSLLSGTKIDLIYLVWNTFYKLFRPKDPHQFLKNKVKNNFRNFFCWHNSKIYKYILKILMDSSLTGQQLKNSN